MCAWRQKPDLITTSLDGVIACKPFECQFPFSRDRMMWLIIKLLWCLRCCYELISHINNRLCALAPLQKNMNEYSRNHCSANHLRNLFKTNARSTDWWTSCMLCLIQLPILLNEHNYKTRSHVHVDHWMFFV